MKRVVLFWLLISGVLFAKGDFYKVVNVANDDVLNMREKDHYKSDLVGTLEHNEDCVEIVFDNDFRWVIVKKDDRIGWVNKKFLKKTKSNCKYTKINQNLTINIYSNYDHHNRIVGLALDEKNNLIASIDQDNILIIRTLNTKKIILKKILHKTGRLKFSPNGDYLNIIDESNNTITIFSFPTLQEEVSYKISNQLIAKVWGLKTGFYQNYRIGNIEVLEGEEEADAIMHKTKQTKHHGRKIYRNNKLVYHEESCGIMDFTMISKYSKKRNSIFFVNGMKREPSIYEISVIDGKRIWDTAYASHGKTNTGGSGAILIYNKKQKLLYALEDIDYIDGEVVVWDMTSLRIVKINTLKDFNHLPYVYDYASCLNQMQITQAYDMNCKKQVNLPLNIYQSIETNDWIIGESILLSYYSIRYDDAIVAIFDKNKNIIARMIKDEMKKYNNSDGMTLLQDGYFTGGKSVPVSTSIGLKSIPINQLYDHFFRPDLVKLKLRGNEKEYQKANKGMSYAEALQNPPPTITFKKKKLITDKNKLKIPFTIKDNKGGVGVIRIYQEGKLIQTIGDGNISRVSANYDAVTEQNRLDKLNQKNQKNLVALLSKAIPIEQSVAKSKSNNTVTNKAGDYTIEIDLVSGKNEIAIEAFNKTNTVASFRESMSVEANIPKKEPKLYAIVIGIDNFEEINDKLQLNYAQKDALMIKEAIEKNSNKSFSAIEIEHIEGKQVTQENIYRAIQTISQKAKLEDTIIFYISTHGRAIHGDLYLVPYNNGDSKNWLQFSQLFNAVQSIKALNQIFIVDACESGQANDIVSSVYDSRASVLAKSAGVHMLLATTKGAAAYEPKKGSNKVNTFTQRILRAMEDKTTDTNSDNLISIVEISNKLKSNMNEVEYQYPIIRNVGSDVKLLEVRK